MLRTAVHCQAVLIVLFGAIGAQAVEAASPLTALTKVPAEPVEFVAINEGGELSFQHSDTKLSLAPAQLTQWGNPQELRGGETVLLRDGSLLTATVTSVDGVGIGIEHDLFDPTTISRDSLVGAVLQRPSANLAFERLLRRLTTETFETDTLLLVNGDMLTGELSTMPAANSTRQQVIALKVAGKTLNIGLERVAAIAFSGGERLPSARPILRMGLRQGDLLRIANVEVAKRSVKLSLTGGLTLSTVPDFLWEDVNFLAGVSPRVTPLTRLEPLSYRHRPLIGAEVELAIDSNVLGGRLRSDGSLFSHGLGMPGSSRVAFRLDGNYKQFHARVGLDDSAGQRGSVVFRVYLRNEEGSLKKVYESPLMRGGDPLEQVQLDVSGASLLVLLVDSADRGDELDYANWLTPRLIASP